jgi:hypothetical protein
VDVQACELKELMPSGHSWLPSWQERSPKFTVGCAPELSRRGRGPFQGSQGDQDDRDEQGPELL